MAHEEMEKKYNSKVDSIVSILKNLSERDRGYFLQVNNVSNFNEWRKNKTIEQLTELETNLKEYIAKIEKNKNHNENATNISELDVSDIK